MGRMPIHFFRFNCGICYPIWLCNYQRISNKNAFAYENVLSKRIHSYFVLIYSYGVCSIT